MNDKLDRTSGTLKEAEMLTLSETQQLPMYEFCYPNTKLDEFDRTSGTFKENEILTSTKNHNEGIVKFDFDNASSEIFRIENINNKIDQAAEALLSLAGQAPIVNFLTILSEFDKKNEAKTMAPNSDFCESNNFIQKCPKRTFHCTFCY